MHLCSVQQLESGYVRKSCTYKTKLIRPLSNINSTSDTSKPTHDEFRERRDTTTFDGTRTKAVDSRRADDVGVNVAGFGGAEDSMRQLVKQS